MFHYSTSKKVFPSEYVDKKSAELFKNKLVVDTPGVPKESLAVRYDHVFNVTVVFISTNNRWKKLDSAVGKPSSVEYKDGRLTVKLMQKDDSDFDRMEIIPID